MFEHQMCNLGVSCEYMSKCDFPAFIIDTIPVGTRIWTTHTRNTPLEFTHRHLHSHAPAAHIHTHFTSTHTHTVLTHPPALISAGIALHLSLSLSQLDSSHTSAAVQPLSAPRVPDLPQTNQRAADGWGAQLSGHPTPHCTLTPSRPNPSPLQHSSPAKLHSCGVLPGSPESPSNQLFTSGSADIYAVLI